MRFALVEGTPVVPFILRIVLRVTEQEDQLSTLTRFQLNLEAM